MQSKPVAATAYFGNVAVTDGKLFRYFDSAGAELGDTSPPQAIKRVRVAFAVQVKDPDPARGGNIRSTLSTSVEFRN